MREAAWVEVAVEKEIGVLSAKDGRKFKSEDRIAAATKPVARLWVATWTM